MEFSQYTTKDISEVFEILKSREEGLSEEEAAERQKIHGFNEIRIKETTLLDVLTRQFKSPFTYLLFIAAIIALSIGEIIDGLLILFFVFVNVSIGFFQEARAVKTAAMLKKYLSLKARVLRNGREKTIDQKFLVPGDIVLLEAGNIIPADLRILKVQNFLVDESILSGESVPVSKNYQPLLEESKEIFKAKNIVFTGTSVISGEAEGIVIETGKQTVVGEVAKLTSETVRESIYEKNLLSFCRLILRIVVITITLVFVANLIIKGTASLFEFLIFSMALIVSIIPEALPVVVTFALSQGVLMLARKKVVVKRLSAVEDLGDIEILCVDKTGTLTENKLQLKNVFSPEKEKCLLYGLLSSPYAKEEIKSVLNPFDLALFAKATSEIKNSLKGFKVISEIPFDPTRLKNSVLLEDKKGELILITRGAPENILKICSNHASTLKEEEIHPVKSREAGAPLEAGQFNRVKKEIEEEGREGKRTLALAFKKFNKKDFTPLEIRPAKGTAAAAEGGGLFLTGFTEEDEKDLTFLGYFSFEDPLKPTAKSAIELAKNLGVQIKILTGDSFEVAGAVAKEIGLIKDYSEIILGENLESKNKEEFERVCEQFNVFARVSPATKFKIVEALQKKHEVGFLGEGINDAPALKIANVAIAVREGADISREVSDIILLKKDLRVLIDGIREGRKIFCNINKYIRCILASNFGNFYSIAAISLIIPFLPMLPIQILLGNLLSDFPLIAVASDSVDIEELRKPKLYQLNKVILLVVFLALTSTIFDFIFFGIFYKVPPAVLQTLWFIESILTELILIFSIRTSGFFLRAKMPSFVLMFLAFLTAITVVFLPFSNLGHEVFHFTTPPVSGLLIVLSLLVSYFIVSEVIKLIYFRHWRNSKRYLTNSK